jgi:hypothetical protein
MYHILPFALYSDIQNLLVSASAIRHCETAAIFFRVAKNKYVWWHKSNYSPMTMAG